MGSHQIGAEGQNPVHCTAALADGDAAQGTVGLLGCQRTLPGHVELSFLCPAVDVLCSKAEFCLAHLANDNS